MVQLRLQWNTSFQSRWHDQHLFPLTVPSCGSVECLGTHLKEFLCHSVIFKILPCSSHSFTLVPHPHALCPQNRSFFHLYVVLFVSDLVLCALLDFLLRFFAVIFTHCVLVFTSQVCTLMVWQKPAVIFNIKQHTEMFYFFFIYVNAKPLCSYHYLPGASCAS